MIERNNEYKKGKGKLKNGKHNKKQNQKVNKQIYNQKHIRITLSKMGHST